MNQVQELLAENLKRIRKERGFSQSDLAELLDISTSFVGEIEIGRKFFSVEILQRFVDKTGIQAWELFYPVTQKADQAIQSAQQRIALSVATNALTKDLEQIRTSILTELSR